MKHGSEGAAFCQLCSIFRAWQICSKAYRGGQRAAESLLFALIIGEPEEAANDSAASIEGCRFFLRQLKCMRLF